MRRIALWGLIALGLFAIVGAATLASRGPQLHFADVRPEIQPIEPEMIPIEKHMSEKVMVAFKALSTD